LPPLLLGAHAAAQAFSCAPTEGQECRLELSTVTIVFDSGIYNFNGESQFIGSDGYVTGYTVGSGEFPELSVVDTNDGQRAGFSFAPPMSGQVGGSGIAGYHEASASFAFSALQFVARPGYRVDGVELSVSGSRTLVGNGYVALTVPGIPAFVGDQFTGTAILDPFSAQNFAGGFLASTYYEEGDGGTATQYGTASVALTAASLIVHVSAVPEPATTLLWLLGGLGLAAVQRSSRRS
jgi:hypothetical protein